jgi:hypothetical protein
MEPTIVVRSEKMPGSCWGVYARVVLYDGEPPAAIRQDDPQILAEWRRCSVGGLARPSFAQRDPANLPAGARCAYAKAIREAREMAAELERLGRAGRALLG